MDSATLLDLLQRSQLVAPEALQPALTSLQARSGGKLPMEANDLANALIDCGLLSNWQANHLLQSRWQGFFLGRYKIVKPLGKGGMGTVYLAEHRVMGHRVAIKVLPKDRLSTPGMLERFRNEARTAAMLDHVNIVRSVDISVHEGQPFIVMEYVAGRDVHRTVYQEGPLPIDMAIRICAQTAAGLQHAHDRGVIHRDIKPSNLLISESGVVKILDMGLAHFTQSTDPQLTADGNGSILGTADFLSPEQALSSRGVDGRSDLYSLGCTLFFMLTGRPPFVADNLVQRLTLHQTATPPDLCTERPDCPIELNAVFQKLMAKQRQDRFASGDELLLELKKIKDGPGSASGKVKASAPVKRPQRQTAPPRDTRSHFSDDTGAGQPTSSGGEDFLSSLPLPPLGSVASAGTFPPPAYLSSSGSDFPMSAGVPANPRSGNGLKSKSSIPPPAPALTKNSISRDTIILLVFTSLVAVMSASAIFYWLSTTKAKSNRNFSNMIRQGEDGSSGGAQVIIISE